jgi:hypothetical protein
VLLAGGYPITASGAVDSNYTITYTPGTLTVNPAALTITANPQTSVYGSALPALTASYSGFVNGDTSSAVTGLTVTTPATAASNVGGYAITPANGTSIDYTITFVPGTLTITPATLTYNATPISQTYGTPVATTGTVTGYVLGQNAATATTGTAVFTTPATQASNVGPYAVTGSGLTADNGDYVFVQAAGNATALTITPAPLTITANNQSKVYGAALPAFTASYSGLENGDSTSVVTGLTLTSPATVSSNVGNIAITPANGVASNYAITFVPGILTITPVTLTYTATPESQVYGTAIPTLPGTVTGFVLGQTLATATTGTVTFTTPATQSSNVGHYADLGSGLTANNGDYTFVQAPGNSTAFTITPATLTYVSTPTSLVTGTPVTDLTGTLTGFVLGQTLATATTGTATFTSTANSSSAPGIYPIDGSGLVAGNYVFVQAPPNTTALDLEPVSATTTTPVSTATNNSTPTPNAGNDNGIQSVFTFFGGGAGAGAGASGGGSSGGGGGGVSLTGAALPPDSGEADTSIRVGRFQVVYQANLEGGQEMSSGEENGSIGTASSFTTFDTQDHPSTTMKHRARGEKDRENNENDNAPKGTS